jgi:hypothetical protein
MSHSAVIYEQGELPLINPFEFNIDPMERLLLVNIEKDLDTTYKGFEPQYFNDEIKSMIRKRDNHQVELSFDPPFPQFNLLKEGVDVEGTFEIHAHISTGKITGKYWVKKNQEQVNISLQPTGGWQPNEKKIAIRFLYTVVKIFKHWPKTYLWSAQLNQDGDNWQMVSKWERV